MLLFAGGLGRLGRAEMCTRGVEPGPVDCAYSPFDLFVFAGYGWDMSTSTHRLTSKDVSEGSAAALRQSVGDASTVTVGSVTVAVSDHARAVLTEVLNELAAGSQVEVRPVRSMLTTQQAADLVRVSRPTLVRMLEQGLLPYDQPGVHRRVSRAAVEEFLSSRRERRQEALDVLARTHDPDGPDAIVRTR